MKIPDDVKFFELKELLEKRERFLDSELLKCVVIYAIEENKALKEAEKSILDLEKKN